MTADRIAARLRTAIGTELGLHEDSIERASRFVEDLSADSLDQIEIAMLAEETFGIAIDEDLAEGFQTFGQLVDHIARELTRRKAARA